MNHFISKFGLNLLFVLDIVDFHKKIHSFAPYLWETDDFFFNF